MYKKLQKIIEELGLLCKSHHITLVTVESCTGGGLTFELSKSKICSPVLERGFITYSNQSKEKLVGVTPKTIQLYGAVSQEIAIEMAEGALKESLAQVSIAVTGIAGDDIANQQRGQAWIGLAIIDSNTITKKFEFSGSREQFIEYVIYETILFVYKSLRDYFDKKTSYQK